MGSAMKEFDGLESARDLAHQSRDWEFLVGTAISVYQNSGGGGSRNNWSEFENQRTRLGLPTIEGGQKCGASSNFWEYYEEDIARVVSLNSTVFRLSLEWTRIEPEQGQIDEKAVARYHAILDCLLRNNLKPVVTLHHFVQPLWFDRMGGFTAGDTIPHFVRFAEFAYREFGRKVHLWITFNEANVMTFCGWLYGQFPPGLLGNFKLGGANLLNMLRAHAAAYDAIKALPGGKESKIGIVHNVMRYEPLRPRAISMNWVEPVVQWLNRVWATEITVEYLRTGVFRWYSPWGGASEVRDARPGLDFIGLNYYGKVSIDWKFASAALPPGVMTDMPFQLDAEGLYEGIKDMAPLDVPIYITETGIADRKGDKRPLWLSTYIPQVERAVRDGYDVRGLMYWTLVDNFEWAHGFHQQFGLYAWSPGDGAKRTERAATPALAAIYKDFPAKMARAREAAQQGKGRTGQNGKAGKAAAAEDPPVNGDASPRTVLQVKPLDMEREPSVENV